MGDVNGAPTGHDWEQVVSEATEQIRARGDVVAATARKQKPKSQGPTVALLSVLLTAAVALNIWQWNKPPSVMPESQERVNMAWTAVDVAEAVESFRADEGRLPTADEIGDLLDEHVTYQLVGDRYAVTVRGRSGSITYDGAEEPQDWARNAWSDPTEADS